MKDISLEAEIEMRRQFRDMYANIGRTGAYQVLYEIVASANILLDIIIEESQSEEKENRG